VTVTVREHSRRCWNVSLAEAERNGTGRIFMLCFRLAVNAGQCLSRVGGILRLDARGRSHRGDMQLVSMQVCAYQGTRVVS
jgi:hypothetical protein